MFRIPISILLLLAACGYVDYDDAPVGRLKGSLFVMWVGEGGPSGDGKFVFVPDPNNRLTLIRTAPNATLREIRPEMMYTDGGSIPKIGQVFNGLSPWGYAPAYMMHDWLFVARQCLNDGKATPEEQKVAAMPFQESAEVIAEAIKTLVDTGQVRENDVAANTISRTVAGPFARARWTVKEACKDSRVSEEDRAAAEAAIPGSSQVRLRGLFRTLPDGRKVAVQPATVVGTFSF
ncbi:MAG: hypothetical protein WBN04_13525 [Paracoccaceae bacterium]